MRLVAPSSALLSTALLLNTACALHGLWRAVPVDLDTLLEGAHKEITVKSEFTCAMLTADVGATVYCYDAPRCVVADGYLERLRGPQTEGWLCKTTASLPCRLLGSAALNLYETKHFGPTLCGDTLNMTCTLSGPVTWTPPLGCCKSPFIWDAVGCLLINSSMKLNWCSARLYCHQQQGQLFSADTPQHFTALRKSLAKNSYGLSDAFVGLYEYEGGWHWQHNWRTQGVGLQDVDSHWARGEPLGSSYKCGQLYNAVGNLLDNFDCSSQNNFICHARVSECAP